MKKIILIIMALAPVFLFAQTVERQVIGSAGGSSSSSGLKVTNTVGEVITVTGTSATLILTQGFQQPAAGSLGIEDIETGLSVNAYPNPAKGIVTLELDAPNALEIDIRVLDFNGTLISQPVQKQKVFGSSSYEIDLSGLAAGNYYLVLKNSKGNLNQTIKIVKAE